MKISSTKEVAAFARQIVKEGVIFHPDDDFRNYVNIKTGKPTYTEKEAELRNATMDECFATCEANGVDIYDIMNI